jgi:hypothetical protein
MKLNSISHAGLILLICLLFPTTSLAANYIVAGAPSPNEGANGLYVEDGTADGVPKYTKGTWTLNRQTGGMGDGWHIIDDSSWVFCNFLNTDNVPPNDGNWEICFDAGVPGLTVTLAEENIPTLNEWGVILMSLMLGCIAIVVIRKQGLNKA